MAQKKLDGKLAFKIIGELDYDLIADVDQAWGAYRLHLVAKELNTKVRQAIELHAYHSWEYSTTPGPMKWIEQVYIPVAPYPKLTIKNCLRLWRLEFYRWVVTKGLPKSKLREGLINWLLKRRAEKVECHDRLFRREENEKVLDNLCECAVSQASYILERGGQPQMVLLGSRSAGVMQELFAYKKKATVPDGLESFEKTNPKLRLDLLKAEHRTRLDADHVLLPVHVDHALNEDAVLVV